MQNTEEKVTFNNNKRNILITVVVFFVVIAAVILPFTIKNLIKQKNDDTEKRYQNLSYFCSDQASADKLSQRLVIYGGLEIYERDFLWKGEQISVDAKAYLLRLKLKNVSTSEVKYNLSFEDDCDFLVKNPDNNFVKPSYIHGNVARLNKNSSRQEIIAPGDEVEIEFIYLMEKKDYTLTNTYKLIYTQGAMKALMPIDMYKHIEYRFNFKGKK